MAKGSAMGLWRGKKGSSVFYRIANSNSQQKQGIRERNYEPANPQTTRQADQRLKMLAAQRLYGVLKPIISRAWQGVKYGQMTRQAYLRKALSMTSGYPYLTKDDSKIVPGSYQISRGSLNTINAECAGGTFAQADMFCDIPQNSTVGQAAQSILDRNPWAQEGDQLTFVVCSIDSNAITPAEVMDSSYIWAYNSMYLDPADTRTMDDAGFGTDGIYLSDQEYRLKISVEGRAVVGAAVILSRLDQTSNTYLRSTTVLAVADSIVDTWMDPTQRQAARRSYQHQASAVSTDWPVEDQSLVGTHQGLYIITGVSGSKAAANGKKCWVQLSDETDSLVAVYYRMYDSTQALVGEDGLALTIRDQMDEVVVTPDDVPALASLPRLQYA